MEQKLRALLSKWKKEQYSSEEQVKQLVEKRQYGDAQRAQTKAVWLEHCINDLEEVIGK